MSAGSSGHQNRSLLAARGRQQLRRAARSDARAALASLACPAPTGAEGCARSCSNSSSLRKATAAITAERFLPPPSHKHHKRPSGQHSCAVGTREKHPHIHTTSLQELAFVALDLRRVLFVKM
eukprot:scaffold82547_cov51-Phaeocystis_antarctica.AAC.1